MKSVPEKNQDNEPDGKPLGLTIFPYAVETFHELERGRMFGRMFYRHKKAGPLLAQLALIRAVINDLTRAGVTINDHIDIRLDADKGRTEAQTDSTAWRVHLEVPVACPQESARIEALRARYGKNS